MTQIGQIPLRKELLALETAPLGSSEKLDKESTQKGIETQMRSGEEDHNKKNPRLGMGGPILSKQISFHELAMELAVKALARIENVRKTLKAKGIDECEPALQQNIKTLEQILQKAFEEKQKCEKGLMQQAMNEMKEIPSKPLPEKLRLETSEQLNLAEKDLKNAKEMLHLAKKKEGEHPEVEEGFKRVDVAAHCISEVMRMTGNIENTLRFLARSTGELNDTLETLLNLEQLIRRYEGLDKFKIEEKLKELEKKDKLKLTEEEKQMLIDIPKMIAGIKIARENGVLWDQDGWETKGDRERYLKGLAACVGMLQTRSKRGDLETQQTMQSYSTHVILCTTLIKMVYDLLKDISRNMGAR
ncbi:MAG: hypothetical protein JSR80_07625 [Verrucomicrobia bacterium]|nr:hypothetical protein [Verrucomicrobiota bacterium]